MRCAGLALIWTLAGCSPADDRTSETPGDSAAADSESTQKSPEDELYGVVELRAYVRVDAGGTESAFNLAGASFGTEPPGTELLEDGECAPYWWDMNGGGSTEVSAGLVEILVDDQVVGATPALWPAGSTFGARATGDVFPAFDIPEAILVPEPVDMALPDTLDPAADLELAWGPPYADRLVVWFSWASDQDAGGGIKCNFVDDGTAVVPSDQVTEAVDNAQRSYGATFGVDRHAELETSAGAARLLFQATWEAWRSYG